MGFTLEHIHRTAKRLGRLLPAKPSNDSNMEYSLKDGIFLMAPKLLEMKRMGFSTGELAAALESEGITIKGQTLNRYLFEYQAMREREAAPASSPTLSAETKDTSGQETPGKSGNTHNHRRKASESTAKSGESVSASEPGSGQAESGNAPDFGKTESASAPDSPESESAKKYSTSSNRE